MVSKDPRTVVGLRKGRLYLMMVSLTPATAAVVAAPILKLCPEATACRTSCRAATSQGLNKETLSLNTNNGPGVCGLIAR